jgi:OOP family OmpA-OmpF porin
MRRKLIAAALCLGLGGWSTGTQAQEASGSAEASTEESKGGELSEAEKHAGDSWIRRYRPKHLAVEIGVFGGGNMFPTNHNLESNQVVPSQYPHQGLKTAAEVGLSLAFYPASFLGLEGEGVLGWSKTKDTDDKAKLMTVRGHGILQLPLGRLVPFVLGGGGIEHISAKGSLGVDTDPVWYFGGGLKLNCNRWIALRVDVRDNFRQKNRTVTDAKDGDMLQQLEILGGLSVTIGRTPWAPAPPDQDGDGIYDRDDKCPADAGPADHGGCPLPPDADRDGIPDNSDPCPTEAEDGNPPDEKDGCPNKDLDKDGIEIPVDLCPDQPGIAPDGCPPKDTDGDGFMDPEDRCPKDPETKNNFEDQDGCPDEVPEVVKKFTGVIKGIQFDSGKAKIRSTSFPLLDDAVGVLKQYPGLRIRISGHTDNKGKKAKNMKLSEDRANAVKDYMTSKGVESSRVETRGVGPDEPIADNKTNAGRTQNRRIEFELLPQ